MRCQTGVLTECQTAGGLTNLCRDVNSQESNGYFHEKLCFPQLRVSGFRFRVSSFVFRVLNFGLYVYKYIYIYMYVYLYEFNEPLTGLVASIFGA